MLTAGPAVQGSIERSFQINKGIRFPVTQQARFEMQMKISLLECYALSTDE
jgi:hypothetical protein